MSCLRAPDAPFVHLTLTLNRGTSSEGLEEHGYYSLLGTLMGRGCGDRTRAEFAEDCDSRGANVNIYPGRDFLTIEAWVLPQDLAWGLTTLAEMVWHPKLEDEEVDVAVEEQLDQLLARRDEKKARIHDAARTSIYDAEHHYSRPLLGRVECLENVDVERLKDFHRSLFDQASAVLCVTGQVTVSELERLVLKAPFPSSVSSVASVRSLAPRNVPNSSPLIVGYPIEQAEVLIALPAAPRWSNDYRLHGFCNEILGGAFLSRLTRAVRIQGGMAYSADSRYIAGLESGLIWVGLQTDRQKLPRALKLVRDVMEELAENPLGREEFEHFRDFVRCSMPLDYDALASLTSRRLETLLYGEPWQLPTRLANFDREITVDAVQGAFQSLLDPQKAYVCVMGEGLVADDLDTFHRASAGVAEAVPPLQLTAVTTSESTPVPAVEKLETHSKGELYRLGSGLRVLVLPRSDVASISVQVWSLTGGIDEEKGKSGLSHLLEHLMFRGTPRFPDGSFDSALAQKGGLNNAFTTEDFTVYTSCVTPDGLEDALVLEADRWQNLRISDEVFEIERSVVLEERSVRVDCHVLGKAYETLQHQALPHEPYGQPVIGWREDLEKLTVDDIHRHYDVARQPHRMLLVLAGGITVDEAMEKVSRCFSGLSAGTAEPFWPIIASERPVVPLLAGHARMEERSGYSYLLGCYRFPREGHPDYEACELLSRIVGDGESCRLYEHFVRETRQFLEVWANYESQAREHPLFCLGFAAAQNFEEAKVLDSVAVFLEELAETLGEEELTKAKRSWLAEDAFGSDELEDWSLEVACRVVLLSWEEAWTAQERIEAVTLEDVKRVAKLYLGRGGLVSLAMQGQSEEEESPVDEEEV